MLAEANLGLRKLKIAEEFLSLANWVLLKHKGDEAGGSRRAHAHAVTIQLGFV